MCICNVYEVSHVLKNSFPVYCPLYIINHTTSEVKDKIKVEAKMEKQLPSETSEEHCDVKEVTTMDQLEQVVVENVAIDFR